VPDSRAREEQNRARAAEFMHDLAERVRRIPGVESASVGNVAPLSAGSGGYNLSYENAGMRRKCEADGRDVDPGYFRTAGIPLLAGHDFEPGDAQRRPLPVILNKAAARELFGAEDPLGKLVACSRPRTTMQVIGLVGDVRMRGVARAPGPEAFAPLMGGWGYASLVIARAAVKPSALPSIRSAVHSLYPDSPPPEITDLDDVFSEQVAKPRFYAALLGVFAGVGLILAAVGIYGVTAYSVARRRHEFGIRLALGAEPAAVIRLALGSGARVVAAGTGAGLAGAWAVTRLLASLLYQVKPRDPLTFGSAAVVLAGTAMAASWLAARRAGSVDPNVALRCE
jgi:predicted permease